MRKTLVVVFFLLCAAVSLEAQTTPVAQASSPIKPKFLPELGGGFNGALADINNALIVKSGVKWVRAYVNIQRNALTFAYCPPGSPCPPDTNPDPTGVLHDNVEDQTVMDQGLSPPIDALSINAILKLIATKSVTCQPISVTPTMPANPQPNEAIGAHSHPRCQQIKIILTLKTDFKYNGMTIPATKDNFVVDSIKELLMLNNLGSYIDILVLGNEPMFETPGVGPFDPNNPPTNNPRCPTTSNNDCAESYANFLTNLIDTVDSLKQTNSWNQMQIFTGALDRPGTSVAEGPCDYCDIVNRILTITASNDKVAGIDLHEHVLSLQNAAVDLDYVNSQIEQLNPKHVTKSIISTEFSLVLLWQSALNVLNPAHPQLLSLCKQLNSMITKAAAGIAVGETTFKDYLDKQPWYPEPQNGYGWFAQFYCVFHKRPNVAAVTYGLEEAPQYPYNGDLLATDPNSDGNCYAGDLPWVMVPAYDGTIFGTDMTPGSPSFGYFKRNPIVYPDFDAVIRDPERVCRKVGPVP